MAETANVFQGSLQQDDQWRRDVEGPPGRVQALLSLAGRLQDGALERALHQVAARPGVIRLPYLEDREFWLAASAVDACVNLRYPAAGETSGIAIRLMGIGKPVLLTDGEACSRYPEDACIRVDAGPGGAPAPGPFR